MKKIIIDHSIQFNFIINHHYSLKGINRPNIYDICCIIIYYVPAVSWPFHPGIKKKKYKLKTGAMSVFPSGGNRYHDYGCLILLSCAQSRTLSSP